MQNTPKALRLQIGLFGRTNVGKSSFLNLIAGQDVAITSEIPGTTTDVVEKTMELLPIGPVVFLDTAGLDDISELAERRIGRTRKIFDRADVSVLIVEPNVWTEFEDQVMQAAQERKQDVIIIVNKIDITAPDQKVIGRVRERTPHVCFCSSIDKRKRDTYVNAFKEALIQCCPDDFLKPPPLISGLLPPKGMAVLITPIDLEAPKGRLILPQVQTIRDILDNDAATIVVKEHQYIDVLGQLKTPPAIVVCDSQVVSKMVADTPDHVKCTTFSILFSRLKGELIEAVRGVRVIDAIKEGDKILIAEACSHHAIEDDIGRVKIPRWIKQYLGTDIIIDTYAGRDYPENLSEYKLIIHCGACMLTRREMLYRIYKAREAGVAITNYGICIAYVQGVLKRVLSPFPAALNAFENNHCYKGVLT
ncbi:MAG: [FeFe] hydrogenase H-cluster maturation GTPase HydF [Candidatus Omnitrophica bacterium]|nr:[FeFe] hydrogenase H-cluster maturation GTPase HydF [Candidatus Omnitrophota bacterium]